MAGRRSNIYCALDKVDLYIHIGFLPLPKPRSCDIPNMASMRELLRLPSELTTSIIGFLENEDILHLRRVCSQLKRVVDSGEIASLCRTRIRKEIGLVSEVVLNGGTVQVLKDLALVRSTCEWLSKAVSDHLALHLPPELCLSSTNFAERVKTLLVKGLFELHLFLKEHAAVVERAGLASAPPWSLIESAQHMVCIQSLGGIAQTFFLMVDMIQETFRGPTDARGFRRKDAGSGLSIADDVVVWMLLHDGLGGVSRLFQNYRPPGRVDEVKRYVAGPICDTFADWLDASAYVLSSRSRQRIIGSLLHHFVWSCVNLSRCERLLT